MPIKAFHLQWLAATNFASLLFRSRQTAPPSKPAQQTRPANWRTGWQTGIWDLRMTIDE
jgi:hypothetical protein